MLRHIESYLESDSFALNQKDILIFLKNLFDTILLILSAFSFFSPFFLSSALLSLI